MEWPHVYTGLGSNCTFFRIETPRFSPYKSNFYATVVCKYIQLPSTAQYRKRFVYCRNKTENWNKQIHDTWRFYERFTTITSRDLSFKLTMSSRCAKMVHNIIKKTENLIWNCFFFSSIAKTQTQQTMQWNSLSNTLGRNDCMGDNF